MGKNKNRNKNKTDRNDLAKNSLSQKNGSENRITAVSHQFYQGPLPPPAILEKYNEVSPGSANIIIQQFQKQSDHRMFLEKKVISGKNIRAYWGLVCGLVIAILGILAASFLIYHDKTVGGSILGGGTLVALVQVFVFGKKSQEKELNKKAEES